MKRKVLIVAAHPDDEVLGCGAVITKEVKNGSTVWILILGQGITSRKSLTSLQKKSGLNGIRKQAKEAGKILGAEKVLLKNLPDNKFDTVPLLKIVQIIESVVQVFRPDVIFTHNSSDVNIDHRKTLEAMESAIRPQGKKIISNVLSFESPSSTEWNATRDQFAPNFFIEISENDLKNKISALNAYKSEVRDFPHPRSFKYLKALATVRGAQSGKDLAEAFSVIRIIK